MNLPATTSLVLAIVVLRGVAAAQIPRVVPPTSIQSDGAVLVGGVWVQPSAQVAWSDLLRFERRETGMTVVVDPRGAAAGPLRGQRLAVLRIGGRDDVFVASQRGQQFTGEGVHRQATRHLSCARVLRRGDADPDTGPLSLQIVEITPQRVMLHGRGTVRDRAVQVTLTLDEPPGSTPATSLVVQPLDNAPPSTLLSGDFAALYRDHPVAARLFAEPLLRTLHGGTSPLRLQAGDVFTLLPELEASAEATERLRDRLPALASMVPAQRDAASRALADAGDDLVLAALRLPREGLSPEVASRLDAFIASRTLHDPEWLLARRDDLPLLIDCLEYPDARVRSAALRRLSRQVRGPFAVPESMPESEVAATVDRLRRALLVP